MNTTNLTADTIVFSFLSDLVFDDLLRNTFRFTPAEIDNLVASFLHTFLDAVASDPERDPDNIEMDDLDFADRDRLFNHDWLTFADAIDTLNTLDSIVGLRADDDHTIFLLRESSYFRLIYELRDLFVFGARNIFGDDVFTRLVSDAR